MKYFRGDEPTFKQIEPSRVIAMQEQKQAYPQYTKNTQ